MSQNPQNAYSSICKADLPLQKLPFDLNVRSPSWSQFWNDFPPVLYSLLVPLGLPFKALGTHFPHRFGVHFSIDFWNQCLMVWAHKMDPEKFA